MTRYALVLVFLFTAGAPAVLAQQASDGVTDQQRLGRQLLSQNCGVCHLPPARNAKTYGPMLHKGTSGGNNDLVRKIILEGTPRMPAFKHMLQSADVDAIIAFVRAVPTPPPAPTAPAAAQ
ncbi:MAG: Cytochrome c protein [Acidobacteria bacterium]|nr:Cytochrome c protein [Acidobacteriota bacterium]